MKNYVAACGFPLQKIGDIPVPRLILGHLPFVGESYQGSEKEAEKDFSIAHEILRGH